MAQADIMEEPNYLNDLFWEVSTKNEMHQFPGHIFVRGRWVNCNGRLDHAEVHIGGRPHAQALAAALNYNAPSIYFENAKNPVQVRR